MAPDALPDTVVRDLAPKIEAFSRQLPAGYRVEVGGIAEESAASRASVLAVVPLMLFLMLTLLMLQLQSFQRLVMVAMVIPLGMIGVVGALLVVQKPLGFVAILGILALLGMIAKNGVILIAQIEDERARGAGVRDAGDDSGAVEIPAAHADRAVDRLRACADRADCLLGAHGVRDHGRLARGDAADARVPAGAVRHLV